MRNPFEWWNLFDFSQHFSLLNTKLSEIIWWFWNKIGALKIETEQELNQKFPMKYICSTEYYAVITKTPFRAHFGRIKSAEFN